MGAGIVPEPARPRAPDTLPPRRGGQYNDGYGPRARHNEFDTRGLGQGSLSAHYADTGIFYSTDARTLRIPDNAFITVFNGQQMTPAESRKSPLDIKYTFLSERVAMVCVFP